MSRRPALVTQADVARVIRAAKQAGAAEVEVRGASIIIHLAPSTPPVDKAIETDGGIVL